MVHRTVLRNETGEEITLRESQGGVLRTMGPSLVVDGEKTVHTYDSATYKEYWCAVQTNDEKVVLTSDDCIDWKKLRIYKETNSDNSISIKWEGTVPRKSKPKAEPVTSGNGDSSQSASPAGARTAADAPSANAKAESSDFLSTLKRLGGKFGFGPKTAGT